MDNNTYNDIITKANLIFNERQKKYGNSIDEIDIHTIIGLIRMKLFRIYKLGNNAKVEDELLDTLNYTVFALDKLYKGELIK